MKGIYLFKHWLAILLLWLTGFGSAQAEPLPDGLAAALVLKLIPLEQRLRQQQDINIVVIGSPSLYELLNLSVGRSLGQGKVGSVSNSLEAARYADVLYTDQAEVLENLRPYLIERSILTLSRSLDTGKQMVALAMYDDEGMPGIMINTSASRRLGIRWEPAILEVASIFDFQDAVEPSEVDKDVVE
jgi:hypothetical protein